MTTILICDDEPFEREALRNLVAQHFEGRLELIGEAENGRTAVELALRYRPDIILMDIQMPLVDGLEASARIREALPETEIVISTAYSQFDYARRAISLRVFEYLVKPVTPEEFIAVVEELLRKIDEERRRRESFRASMRTASFAKELLERECLFSMLIGGKGGVVEFSESLRFLQLEDSCYIAGLVRIFSDEARSSEILTALKGSLRRDFERIVAYGMGDEAALLLVKPRGTHGKGQHEDLSAAVARAKGSAILCSGFSGPYVAPDGCDKAFSEAREALNEDIARHGPEEKPASRRITDLENRLCNGVICQRTVEIEALLRQLFLVVSGSEPSIDVNHYARRLLGWLEGFLDRFFGARVFPCSYSSVQSMLDRLEGTNAIAGYCLSVLVGVTDNIDKFKRTTNESLVEQVRSRIDSKLDTPLTIGELADSVSLSEGHLRKIFRVSQGEGIKEYIVRRKMEKAAELLRQKRLLIKEVAERTGFEDQNYFSRSFKEYFGISPRDYMNR